MSEGANGERGSANGGRLPGEVRSHEDLDAWKSGVARTEAVSRATAGFPPAEPSGLQSPMRRAAVSVPSNIAEGGGRKSRTDHVRFPRLARGSLFELRTQREIAQRVGPLSADDAVRIRAEADRVGPVLYGLASSPTK